VNIGLRKFILAFFVLAFASMSALAADQPAVTIKMTAKKQFSPAKVTIKVGQTVEWISEDPQHGHDITTDPSEVEDSSLVQIPNGAKPFTSKMLHIGEKFSYKFNVPGTYKYACPPHEANNMVGVIEVVP
jgi:plastocyanin